MKIGILLLAAVASAGELTVSQRAEPRTFHPMLAADQPTRDLLRHFLSDVIRINRETLKTEPVLAESWKVAADGKSISVVLKQNLRFSDGGPLTVDDVLFSLGLYVDETLGSPQRDLLQVGGKPPDLERTGPRSFVIRFAKAYGPAERVFDALFIVPKRSFEAARARGELKTIWSAAARMEELVGSGPFRPVRYERGRQIVFERNPHYWRAGYPRLDRLTVRFFADAEAEALQFRAGTIDLLTRTPAPTFAALARELQGKGYQFLETPASLEYHFLFFNQNRSASLPEGIRARQQWFFDERFRRAVSLAMDREAAARLAYGGKATPIWQPVSPANRAWFHAGLKRPGRDVAAARALLKAAGFRWNSGGTLEGPSGAPVEFTVVMNAGNTQHQKLGALLVQDLAELGIKIRTVGLEFRSLVDRILNTRDYDAAIMALAAGDADPGAELSVWLSSGRSHFWNLNPAKPDPAEREINRLMEAQMLTADFAERRRLYARVQEVAQQTQPLICLLSPGILTVARPGLRGVGRGLLAPYALFQVEEMDWVTPR